MASPASLASTSTTWVPSIVVDELPVLPLQQQRSKHEQPQPTVPELAVQPSEQPSSEPWWGATLSPALSPRDGLAHTDLYSRGSPRKSAQRCEASSLQQGFGPSAGPASAPELMPYCWCAAAVLQALPALSHHGAECALTEA